MCTQCATSLTMTPSVVSFDERSGHVLGEPYGGRVSSVSYGENAMVDVVLRDCRVVGQSTTVDIAVESGRISWIGERFAGDAHTVIDCAGNAVMPGLIEPHLHLDKALLDAE